MTGEPISALQGVASDTPDIDFVRLALIPADRLALHRRIEDRFLKMMEIGFLDEVRKLRAMPEMKSDCTAIRAVGYRQLWEHLDGQVTREEAIRKGVVATRRLAKRQLTWMRAEQAEWQFDCLQPNVAAQVIDAVQAHIGELS